VRVGIISDTHIPGRAKALPSKVFELFKDVDLILHAGDFVSPQVLDELSAIAETKGVVGNMDDGGIRGRLPDREFLTLDGVSVGMVHDSGLGGGRRQRMRKMFPDCRVVVFGHSHQPLIEDDGDLLLLNPGSACDPRKARVPTIAVLDLRDGRPEAELIQL
jgi:putative phosphoesterase